MSTPPNTSRLRMRSARASREQRIELIEMLWSIAYADGVLDPEEDALIRQIAGLIHVPDKARGMARQRVLARVSKNRPKK